MNKRVSTLLIALLMGIFFQRVLAQNDSVPILNTLKIEVRADLFYEHPMLQQLDGNIQHLDNNFGFNGRYFNIIVGGNISQHFSYYFRQRVVANPGSVSFFDNTDFLWINYKINDRWSLRLGKDAMTVGGFEYDAPPIDVLFSTFYWDNYYCFQLMGSASYTTKDEKSKLTLQISSSPYVHYGSTFKNSLLAYNFQWFGSYGPFRGSYSIGLFQRDKTHYMCYLAIGNKLVFKKWDIYFDFIHRANSTHQIMRDFSLIACANYYFNENISIFIKGSYEQNKDLDEYNYFLATGEYWDCLAIPGQIYASAGIGFEYRPKKCTDVRIHGFLTNYFIRNDFERNDQGYLPDETVYKPTINLGVTWYIDFMKYINKKVK